MILPPSTVGVVGGGQLGRMFGLAARRLGYGFHVFDPQPGGPAGQIAGREFAASYWDVVALREFAATCAVVTFEFENIPVEALEELAATAPVLPDPAVLHICQNRAREKAFLTAAGFPCAPYELVDGPESLTAAVGRLGTPAVLKTADFGYDGKGQAKLGPDRDLAAAWRALGAPLGVLEGWVDFACELSVICARTRNGEVRAFPPAENIHTRHILDLSIVPARIDPALQAQAVEIASALTAELKVVGLLAVEFFLTRSGRLLVNELAPRTHNSGHWTLDACATSQFEQQLRAVCGLPLGATDILRPAAMANILGEVWAGGPPRWDRILADPSARLHLYGKAEARPGRKMGHFTVLAESADEAAARAAALRDGLAVRPLS